MATHHRHAGEYQPFRLGDPSHLSPRQSYPSFISIRETSMLQAAWIGRGLYDAFRWNVVISSIFDDAEIRNNVYKSLLLNSLSLISIYVFDFLIQPLVQDQERWFYKNISWFYHALWLLPIVGVSFYLNSLWCSIIAKRTYVLQYGTRAPAQQPPVTYTGMLKTIATSAYRVVMVVNSVVVSFLLHKIPYVGWIAGFAFLCWVDAYYFFEYVWIARGLSLPRRIRHLEERWAYYFAFGLPSAVLCSLGTGLANVAIFALIFPVYIILATVARPVPADPYNPASPKSRSDSSDVIRHPSPFIPIRLPVFGMVMWLNNTIVRIFSVGPPSKRPGHGRTLSDDNDAVEEGGGVELEKTPRPPARPTRGRINISRRKND